MRRWGRSPRWAPGGGISGGEGRHSCRREQLRQRRAAATAQGALGIRHTEPSSGSRSLGDALRRKAGELTTGTRCESAGQRGCGKTPRAAGSHAHTHTHARTHAHTHTHKHTALPSPPSGLLKCHLLGGPSPDSIDLKLQTLPTPDAPCPHQLHFFHHHPIHYILNILC